MVRVASLVSMALATALTAAIAHAEGATVYQEDKKFSEPEVTIKTGQSVVFANKDPFTHNVYSKTPGMSFDLRTQKSGESSEVKFDHAGESEVQCAIHPQMKMKIKVTD
jgi:plastocyanin